MLLNVEKSHNLSFSEIHFAANTAPGKRDQVGVQMNIFAWKDPLRFSGKLICVVFYYLRDMSRIFSPSGFWISNGSKRPLLMQVSGEANNSLTRLTSALSVGEAECLMINKYHNNTTFKMPTSHCVLLGGNSDENCVLPRTSSQSTTNLQQFPQSAGNTYRMNSSSWLWESLLPKNNYQDSRQCTAQESAHPWLLRL